MTSRAASMPPVVLTGPPPLTMWATTTDQHRVTRPGTTHVHHDTTLYPPPSDMVEFGPPLVPLPHHWGCMVMIATTHHGPCGPPTLTTTTHHALIRPMATNNRPCAHRLPIWWSCRWSLDRSGPPTITTFPHQTLEGTTNPRSARATRKNGARNKADPCSTPQTYPTGYCAPRRASKHSASDFSAV